VGIVTLITLGNTKFLSVTEELTFKEAFDKILEIKVAVFYVITGLIAYWIIPWFFRKILKKEKTYYIPKPETQRQEFYLNGEFTSTMIHLLLQT
jgi:uncharacterized protein involved in response to NO